jgi:hypothetical protein
MKITMEGEISEKAKAKLWAVFIMQEIKEGRAA